MSEEKEIASVVPENPENSETISEDISAESRNPCFNG